MLWRNLLVFLGFLVFSCNGSETPTQIFNRLMVNYSRNEPPGYPDKATEVKIGMHVLNLQYLGDKSSEFLATFYLRQHWKDPRLSFSTTDGKMNTIRFPDKSWKEIWVPDTFIRDAREVKVDSDMSSNRLLKVTSDGGVLYSMKLSVIIPIRFDHGNYHEQQLRMTFESYGYTMDTLRLTTKDHAAISFEADIGLPAFTIRNFHTVDCSENYTSGAYACLQIVFALERDFSDQLVLQFYLPSIIVVILSWLAFWIDLETSSSSRLLTGFLSLLALILLNGVTGYSTVTSQTEVFLGRRRCWWTIVSYVLVFGTLVEFAVVNILWKRTSGARGLEYLKPPLAGAEKAIEANGKNVDGSGEDGKRKARLVDWFSRILFPVAFLLFNVTYWIRANA